MASAVEPIKVTGDQFAIMFLMHVGAWDCQPLTNVVGWWMCYEICVTPTQWQELHDETITAEIARRALDTLIARGQI